MCWWSITRKELHRPTDSIPNLRLMLLLVSQAVVALSFLKEGECTMPSETDKTTLRRVLKHHLDHAASRTHLSAAANWIGPINSSKLGLCLFS